MLVLSEVSPAGRIVTVDCDVTVLDSDCVPPTESPGDEQRGIWHFAWMEAGESEESQRTFLKG